MEFQAYIRNQKAWSLKTFGEGKRIAGNIDHIRHELIEIEQAKTPKEKLEECIDVMILAMDIAWRLGFEAGEIEYALFSKHQKNFSRKWPPKEQSEANQDKSMFHIKEK